MELEAERRTDEVRLYRGRVDDEIVIVYVSSTSDCAGYLNARVVFCDLAGAPIEERVIRIARSRKLAFRITRLFKPEFIYPPKELPDAGRRRQTIGASP